MRTPPPASTPLHHPYELFEESCQRTRGFDVVTTVTADAAKQAVGALGRTAEKTPSGVPSTGSSVPSAIALHRRKNDAVRSHADRSACNRKSPPSANAAACETTRPLPPSKFLPRQMHRLLRRQHHKIDRRPIRLNNAECPAQTRFDLPPYLPVYRHREQQWRAPAQPFAYPSSTQTCGATPAVSTKKYHDFFSSLIRHNGCTVAYFTHTPSHSIFTGQIP